MTVGHVGPMANEYVADGVPFLRSQNVRPFRIDLGDVKYISADFHQRLAKSALVPGDVVVVRTGVPGTAAVIPRDLPVANCADLVVIRPGPGLDARFLCYFINGVAQGYVSSRIVGAVQQHFNVGAARMLEVPALSLREQSAIGEVLGAIDDKIDLNRRVVKTLERLFEALFRAVVSEATEPAQLGMVMSTRRDGVRPSEAGPGTPYVGLEHLTPGSIAVDRHGLAEDVTSAKVRFARGAILFGKLRPYFKKVAVPGFDGVCSADILVITAKPGWFGFVLGHLSSDELIAYADSASTGTKMPRVSWGDLARYEVQLLDESAARQLDARVTAIIDGLHQRVEESSVLGALRDALLPRLMSGELRVPHAEKLVEQVT